MNGVEASRAEAMAAVNSQIESLSQTVAEAMEGSMTEAEIRESIQEHLASYLESAEGEQMEVRPTEKDFVQLEVSSYKPIKIRNRSESAYASR